MVFPYKHVLMIGATSGIGKSLSDHFIDHGVKVTAVGRRQDRLDDLISQYGRNNVKTVAFDIARTDKIPKFAADVVHMSPDIDCVFLNAGIQRRYDFSKPEEVDLHTFNTEMHVNFTSFVALTHAFIPLLAKQKAETGLIYTGTHLSVVPAPPMPAYSASKAALSSFILCVREQLSGSNIKVVEIWAPPVQTELHDFEMGPEAGRKFGMPVDKFTQLAYDGLSTRSEDVVIGTVGGSPREALDDLLDKRRSAFDALVKLMRTH